MRHLLALLCVAVYCTPYSAAIAIGLPEVPVPTEPSVTPAGSGNNDGEAGGSGEIDFEKPVDLEPGDVPDLELGSGESESGSGSGSGHGNETETEVTDIPVDLEQGDVDDLEPGSGTLEPDSGSETVTETDSLKYAWVQHLRSGDTIFPDPSETEEIAHFAALNGMGTSDCYASEATKETSDGPARKLPGGIDQEPDKFLPIFGCNEEVKDIHHSPEFAVGVLDNECTAFLVGPHHALTLAKCVYDNEQRIWREDLDFWRGRNKDLFLQRMEWEEVYVPRKFFSESQNDQWALISFSRSQPSPVWLSFGYCPQFYLGPAEHVLVYGYHGDVGKMGINHCFAPSESEMQCRCPRGESRVNDISFDASIQGGPILNEVIPEGGKTVPVMGMSQGQSALSFDSNQFWSICFLLMKSGFEPNCDKLLVIDF